MTDRYNGWANYETWNMALWLGNDEPLYREAREFAREHGFSMTATDAENLVRRMLPRGTPDFRGKLGGAKAYKVVKWQEIANHLNEE